MGRVKDPDDAPNAVAGLRSAGLRVTAARPAILETVCAGDHLVCRRCGRVTGVDRAIGAAPCLEPADDAGYVVDEADVTFWGICPDCRRAP